MLRRTLIAAAPAFFIRPAAARIFGKAAGISIQQINTLDSIGGSVVNAYGTWGFDRSINGPTGAGPPGPFGPFNYVTLNGKVISAVGLFGPGPVRSGCSQIVIDFGGNAFFLTGENDRQWYEFSNYDGFRYNVGSPFITTPTGLPLPTPGPYPPPSADGTTITSAPGSVVSVNGVWTNGAGGSSWFPKLNGVDCNALDPTRSFNQLTIGANGNLFAFDITNGHWWAMLSFNSYNAGSSVPTGPIPVAVRITPNPALVTLPNPHPQITTTTASGTVIGTVAVTMSDGSPFTGSLTFAEGFQSWLGFSGMNVVTTAVPGSGAAGIENLTIGATQGGIVGCSPGASTVVLVIN